MSTANNAVPAPVRARTWSRRVRRLARSEVAYTIVQRVFVSLMLLLVVTVLSFLLLSLAPGDPARLILGTTATPGEIAGMRHQLGLDRPLYSQYWTWIQHAVAGNFGNSIVSGQAVGQTLTERLPVTLWLVAGALLISIVLGVGLGVFSAVKGGAVGRLVDSFALVSFAVPSFWLGALMIVLFAVKLHWLPATGYVPPTQSVTQWLRSLALPVVALGLAGVAGIAKQTREAMLEALNSEYVRIAKANGIRNRSIVFRHALKSSAVRIVTMIGLQAIAFLGGTVVVENVFNLPGLGTEAVLATSQHDIPTVQGIVVCFTLIVIAINILVDLASTVLDPRLRTQ